MNIEKTQLDRLVAHLDARLGQWSPGTDPARRSSLARQRDEVARWAAWMEENYCNVPMTAPPDQALYEPSAALRHFWLGYFCEKTHVPFNIVAHYSMDGFNKAAFRRACADLVARHEILRTVAVFDPEALEVKQKVLPAVDANALVRVVPPGEGGSREARLAQHQAAAAGHIFEYTEWPLFYFTVLPEQTGPCTVILNLSHAIADAWSRRLFESEFIGRYAAYAAARPKPLPPPGPQFKDYAAWENNLLKWGIADRFRAYWFRTEPTRHPARNLSTHLGKAPATDPSQRAYLHKGLPPYLKHPDEKTLDALCGVVGRADRTAAKTYRFAVGKDLLNRLNRLARESSTNLSVVITAALNVLMHRVTGLPDLVIGANIALRDRLEVQEMLGFLVNLILIRTRVTGDLPFSAVLTETALSTALASFHKNYTLSRLLDDLDIPYNAIDTVFLNVLPPQTGLLADFSKQHTDEGVLTIFDLDLHVQEYANGLAFSCNYDAALYTQTQITDLFDRLVRVFEGVTGNPETRVDQLQIGEAAYAGASGADQPVA